jgi:two-component system phosphate regulon sensor histidine kinase PhoR
LTVHLEHHFIMGDRESLMQIFINLIDNAIKYNNPQGEILLSCIGNENDVVINVKDTGIGIPLDSRDKIFEPFYTVNKDRSRQSGSTGLGLALVKELVERHKGTIKLLEAEGIGTTLEIIFPICKECLQV